MLVSEIPISSSVESTPGHKNALATVAVIDDDVEMLSLLEEFLGQGHIKVVTFKRASEALIYMAQAQSVGASASETGTSPTFPDLVVSDIRMPQMTGLDLTRTLKKEYPSLPVILTTGFGTIDGAIEAMKLGAYDYITKPFRLGEVKAIINRALETIQMRRDLEVLRGETHSKFNFKGMIGKSVAMRNVFDLIERVAPTKATVLIQGESGTGKEMVARALHQMSPRSAKPFVAINCAAIPENLLESELFGHARGAFTGATGAKRGLFLEASGGTLFLDEIGDMPVTLQAKLLRVLQEQKIRPVGENSLLEIDVRVICATHRDLKQMVQSESFREDLYYRLSVIPIHVPSLTERKEDILLLADYFLKKHAAINQINVKGFKQNAVTLLTQYHWPGNVRELENLVERGVILAQEAYIDAKDIELRSPSETFEKDYQEAIKQCITLEELEKKYIDFVLQKVGGKKEKAAQILGINRRTLYRK